jgi:hypothetical protein
LGRATPAADGAVGAGADGADVATDGVGGVALTDAGALAARAAAGAAAVGGCWGAVFAAAPQPRASTAAITTAARGQRSAERNKLTSASTPPS